MICYSNYDKMLWVIRMTNGEIRARLFEMQDLKYKEFHSGLCPGTDNIIGVRTPELRALSKQIAEGDIDEYLKNAQDRYYEEILLQGMVIGLIKKDIKKVCFHLKSFIGKIDNWAVCDLTVTGLKITKNHQNEMLDFLKDYLKSKNEFEVRFSVVMLLSYYITDDYIDTVLDVLKEIKHEGYYVKMAVSWALSVAFIKYREKTMNLFKHNDFDDFTFNKAIQKINESYRVEKSVKEELKKMKR